MKITIGKRRFLKEEKARTLAAMNQPSGGVADADDNIEQVPMPQGSVRALRAFVRDGEALHGDAYANHVQASSDAGAGGGIDSAVLAVKEYYEKSAHIKGWTRQEHTMAYNKVMSELAVPETPVDMGTGGIGFAAVAEDSEITKGNWIGGELANLNIYKENGLENNNNFQDFRTAAQAMLDFLEKDLTGRDVDNNTPAEKVLPMRTPVAENREKLGKPVGTGISRSDFIKIAAEEIFGAFDRRG